MTMRTWVTAAALVAAAVTLSGCGQQGGSGDPTGEPSADTSAAPTEMTETLDPSATDDRYDALIPRNSTGQTVVFRDEGDLSPDDVSEGVYVAEESGAWSAKFACSSDTTASAEISVDGAVKVEPTEVPCDGSVTTLKFSGGGEITLQMSVGTGYYVMQLSKDEAV